MPCLSNWNHVGNACDMSNLSGVAAPAGGQD